MSQNNPRIPDEIAKEVLDLASRYYAEYQDSYSQTELVNIGGEVEIPPELIEKAIADIQRQREEAKIQQLQKQDQQKLLRKIGIGVGFFVGLWSIFTYNQLSGAKSEVRAAWAQVENQQQRRADLIPNLVDLTKAYANQEERIVSQLIAARENYLIAETPTEKSAAIATIDEAISDFSAYTAQNPAMTSNQLFTNLQYELAGTANRLAVERKRYNESVSEYEQKINGFPNVIIAKIAGFNGAEFSSKMGSE
ncbi:MAG: LemA family protein [Limnothrix sp.]